MKGEKSYFQIIEGVVFSDCRQLNDDQFVKVFDIQLILNCSNEVAEENLPPKVKQIKFASFNNIEIFSSVLMHNEALNLVNEVNERLNKLQGVLVCMDKSDPRGLGLCCVIIMVKFQWNLLKTLQFLSIKIPKIEIGNPCLKMLLEYDKYTLKTNAQTSEDKLWVNSLQICDEAILQKNTYLNSRKQEQVAVRKTNKVLTKRVNFQLDFTLDQISASNRTRFSEKIVPSIEKSMVDQPLKPDLKYAKLLEKPTKIRRRTLSNERELFHNRNFPSSERQALATKLRSSSFESSQKRNERYELPKYKMQRLEKSMTEFEHLDMIKEKIIRKNANATKNNFKMYLQTSAKRAAQAHKLNSIKLMQPKFTNFLLKKAI